MAAGVSYVVTVYNKAEYLRAVLGAIAVEHAETSGEIIIIDDGSTDGSAAILKEFAAGHSAVQIITQENSGVAAATNRGIAAAQNHYLRLIDGDDVLVTGSTRHLIDALTTTGCGFAFGQFANALIGDAPQPVVSVIDDPLAAMLHRQLFIPATTLGLTLTMQQALPLPENFRTAQDFSLGLKLAQLTPFARTSALCCIQPLQAGLSANKGRMFQDTVLLALKLGVEQGWPAAYRRMAVARSAGRARNYLRRHVEGAGGTKAGVSLVAVMAKIPFFWPYKRLMNYIANAYSLP